MPGARPPSPLAASSAAAAEPSFSDADAPTLVYVLLGAPRFQHHVLDSLRQARLLNPRLRIVLVADEALLRAQRPAWPALLRGPGMRVRLVNASGALLESDLVVSFRARFAQLWQELLTRKLREGMLPSVPDERGDAAQNDAFTRFTAERLFVLHSLMRAFGLRNVVHVENDQMLYGRGGVARAAAAVGEACGLRLAMTRIGRRLSPAVLFARDAEALRDMLDFMLEAVSHGYEHAVKVADSSWVTDMTLTAAYFNEKRPLTATLPNRDDGSCVARATGGTTFDAAPLGHWCCGDFETPDVWREIRDGESEAQYWDRPLEWRAERLDAEAAELAAAQAERRTEGEVPCERCGADGGGGGGEAGGAGGAGGKKEEEEPPVMLWAPFWDGREVFNLHVHSKKLFRYGSLGRAAPAPTASVTPSPSPTPSTTPSFGAPQE